MGLHTFSDTTGELYLSNCSYLFIVVLLTFSRVIIDDCTGEMNLPLRLRCVRCYTFMQWMNFAVCLLDYEMMYGRDESAPTPTECSLILRNEWALWCVCWIMNGCRARWICPYVYGVFADITQWINLAVCLLDYEWCTGEINQPLRLRCVRWYYAMNEPCCVFVGLWNDVRAR